MVSQRFLSSKIKTTEDDFNEKKQNSQDQAIRQVTYTYKPHSPFHNGHQDGGNTTEKAERHRAYRNLADQEPQLYTTQRLTRHTNATPEKQDELHAPPHSEKRT
ncbi:hypothetical protein Bca4012_004521 [Brassica carinata]|uniref:Uncharacterized protein n=1 Tax=Brassica carinata TaxID=52824 RepID=A0A8X7RU69_BRACI|nr:hypothetical protein Bca52824_041064 [Brassica carinata]